MQASQSLKLFPSNEVVGAVLTDRLEGSARQDFEKDPQAFLVSNFNMDGAISFATVTNDESTVNLTLPYYSVVEQMSADSVLDEDLSEIAGGEFFFIALPAILGFGIGMAATVAATGTFGGAAIAVGVGVGAACGIAGATIAAAGAVGTAAVVQLNEGKNIDGSRK